MRDGFVSLEVSPRLADDTDGTLEEARRFWKRVARPNLFIKIPATEAGIPAIERAIADGISVNVTLLFSVRMYERVMEAYHRGLEARVASGLPVQGIHSVASFFVSRVDSAVDKALDKLGTPQAKALLGKLAVANAKVANDAFFRTFATPRWAALEAKGANVQRVLWASTGTKNKAYPDILYVQELIGPRSVNTMPEATLKAFNDHGDVRRTVDVGLDEARAQLAALEALGISLEQVCDDLTRDGVKLFDDAFTKLLHVVEARSTAARDERDTRLARHLGGVGAVTQPSLDAAVKEKLAQRLWARDASLWSAEPKHQAVAKNRLGWLDLPAALPGQLADLKSFVSGALKDGFKHALLLGMGGSSLAPEVLARVFGPQPGFLTVRTLDSTAPEAVRASVDGWDLTKTLFIVATKSGTTTETSAFYRHFRELVATGSHFVAITDPGSKLEALAKAEGFRRIFTHAPDVGGRYAALTYVGLVPAALLGLDLDHFAAAARRAALAYDGAVAGNAAVSMGVALGALAGRGVNKLTLLASPDLAPLGAWIEQLVAESTGKDGRGIVPIAGEAPGAPADYGSDRVFATFKLAGEKTPDLDRAVTALIEAGAPVFSWQLADRSSLAGEFLRWEIATAAAASVLGVDAFDEPNVTESKEETRAVLAEGAVQDTPVWRSPVGLAVYAPQADALRETIRARGWDERSTTAWLAALLSTAKPGDYLATLAYLPQLGTTERSLEALRTSARNRLRLATTLGFGPRFLHSTGQLHKGGPASGVFLQVTHTSGGDVAVPGEKYTFGQLLAAQAAGDLRVLARHGRRALRVNLDNDDAFGAFALAFQEALELV